MAATAQFRPVPPPALTSDAWVRDYNEVKSFAARTALGAAPSRPRSLASGSTRYRRSITASCVRLPQVGRDLAQNARLFAGGAGDGRRDDRRFRREVSLQLLASGHCDPQRRHRAMTRHSAKLSWTSFIDLPVHRGIQVRTAHSRRRGWHGVESRDRQGSSAGVHAAGGGRRG